MTLAEELAAISAASAEKMPADVRRVMHEATAKLIDDGLASRSVRPGEAFPEMTLGGADGEVSLGGSGSDTPLVLTWFRGNW